MVHLDARHRLTQDYLALHAALQPAPARRGKAAR
jgi:hypothetical protein